jgi:16S rRNA (uracil1498-N3)-methyltransferase
VRVAACAESAAAIEEAAGARLFLDETGGAPLLASIGHAEDDYSLCTGPEGGWTDQERQRALAAGWQATTLGESILRSETATLAAVSQIQGAWWGRVG